MSPIHIPVLPTANTPLNTLLRRARLHDAQAFCEIVRRFQRLTFACAFSDLRDHEAALDVVQDVFFEAYRTLPTLRHDAAFANRLRFLVGGTRTRWT